MKIFSWDEILHDLQNECQCSLFSRGSGISVGSFDGLHKGHRILFKTLVEESRKKNISSGVITFKRPLPSIKHSSNYQGDVSTLNQRLNLFEQLGLDFVILADFNSEFAARSGSDFFQLVMKLCNMKILVEGIDFRCGYKGATDSKAIQEWAIQNNVKTFFVPPVYYINKNNENIRISSSFIRELIEKGQLDIVKELLNYPYELDLQQIEKIKLSSNEYIIKRESLLQVLPPYGIFNCKNEAGKNLSVEIKTDDITFSCPSEKIIF